MPEIGLTPRVAADLYGIFGEEVAILHSSLSDDERAEQWHRLSRGEARIAVGTRSAVFAPVKDLALIIVDEEQDHSYKQDETPRYHARDVAAVRAKGLKATVVFGSATPSLESYHNAISGKYALLRLPDRVQQRPLPEVELIDMREEFQASGKEHLLSRKLIEEVTLRLERGEQAMILLNRRGYSAFVMCRACGDTIQCRNCAIALTHHKREHKLMCHYCGYQQAIPRLCPKCGSDYVQFLGTGSEKLEDILHAAFPTARIGRMDRDTVRGHHDFERILGAFGAGETGFAGGYADDRQRTRRSWGHAGRRRRRRHRLKPAGLQGRRTHLPVAHTGCRPRRTRLVAGKSRAANLLPRALRGAVCGAS